MTRHSGRTAPEKASVLFVCMGNICRSPLAEGAFRHVVETAGTSDRIHIDSAGTHFYHAGEKPDSRSIAIARASGLDISMQRARQVCEADFETFNYILAMDKRNLRDLKALMPPDATNAPILYLERFAPQLDAVEVPDPYYGGEDGFETVFRMVETAAQGLFQHIQKAGCLEKA